MKIILKDIWDQYASIFSFYKDVYSPRALRESASGLNWFGKATLMPGALILFGIFCTLCCAIGLVFIPIMTVLQKIANSNFDWIEGIFNAIFLKKK